MKSDNKQKVVFQLSNNDTFVHKSLIRQLHNILNEVDDIAIEVMTHSFGVDFLLKSSPFKGEIKALHKKDVHFLVCQNTLDQEKLDPSELLPLSKIIGGGLAHIIKRQSEGWCYIKAGF